MKEADNWNPGAGYPPPPSPDSANAAAAAQQQHWPPGYGASSSYPERLPNARRKKKWVAGWLSFMIPGTGHMYLGLMGKGIVLMLMIALDIVAITQVSNNSSALPVLFFSLLIPIIYFYTLFDAIQSTDAVNDRSGSAAASYGHRAGWGPAPSSAPIPGPYPEQTGWEQAPLGGAAVQPDAMQPPQPSQPVQPQAARGMPPVAILVVAGVGVLMLLTSGSSWTHKLFNSAGSAFGAVILIGAGIVYWFWENRGHKAGRN